MKLIFDDPIFSFELLRTLGYALYGGADVGEVLQTAQQIEEGNFDSWYTNWRSLADKTLKRANEFNVKKEKVSARDNFFKASNYYRAGEFFLHGTPDDPRLMKAWSASRDTFLQAMSLSVQPFEKINIPYADGTLPAYFYTIDEQPRPTLIVHGGYDSTGEELYFQVAQDALKRGYNVLTFEGPGQGAMLREQHVAFRPDWEQVVSPVVDYLMTQSEVKKDQITLMGISFGGLLAARAAAFEPRLAGVILDDGVFSFSFNDAFRARSKEPFTDEAVNEKVHWLMNKSTNVRWVIENGLFTFGAKNLTDLFKKTEAYTLNGIVEKIQIPTLVCEAAGDMFFKGQPEKVYDGLKAPKKLMTFTEADGSAEHCHMGALQLYNQRVFDWLGEILTR